MVKKNLLFILLISLTINIKRNIYHSVSNALKPRMYVLKKKKFKLKNSSHTSWPTHLAWGTHYCETYTCDS